MHHRGLELPGDDDLLAPHDDALLLRELREDLGVSGQPVSAPARLDVLHHLLELLVRSGGELHHLPGEGRGQLVLPWAFTKVFVEQPRLHQVC